MAFNARDASPADKEQINEMEARALQERLDAEQIDAFIAEEFANLDEENQAFDEELAKVTATERLAALRSNEYRLAAQQAEKAAKAVEAAEAAKQLAARQLAEKQKPIKPQKQPSKKQPSKKKDPSPSSVIEDLGLEDLGLTDLELAILRSLDDEQDEGREASQKPFEEWINEFSEEHPARAKLYDLFNGGGWEVVNPRADGFCGLYVAAIDFQNNHSPNTDPMLLERVQEVQRDGLIELIIDGMKKYYEARNRHIELGIRIPSELADNKYFNVDDTTYEDFDGDLPVLRVSEDNFIVTEELLVNDEDSIRAKLRVLERLGNTPEALFVYLPYIYKRSYLILSYDGRNPDTPYLTTFMPCLADVRKDARGNATYPYGGFTNSAIMFNNGHYFLLNNPDSAIKAEVITNILANKFSDEPLRLWQVGVAEGRRLRKRKVGTQKGRTKKGRTKKGRTKKGRTKKGRTQKPRPHRSLRRKHKPKTHIKKTIKTIKYLAK
jgi:hypothetical protein